MIPRNVIHEAVERISREFMPERIILFGSYADGTATEDSDVDLLVILPFEGKNLDKSVEILTRIDPRFPTDLMARRPEDTRRRYEMGDPLIRDALDHGVVVYERSR